MADVLAMYSGSHHTRVDVFREELAEHDVRELELPAGGLYVGDEEEVIEALDGCEALWLRPGHVTRRVIESNPELRVIAVHGGGYDHVDVDAATDNGVVVVHSPEGPAPSVVEHTFGFMFSLLRDLQDVSRQVAEGNWMDARIENSELGVRTVGVVGLGTIGFQVARIASQAFGADVVAHDPYVTGELTSDIYPRVERAEAEAAGIDLVDLDDLFERSDVVTLHTPFTEHTAGMVGERQLELLDGGYLVNTSRGGVVDESALVEAVEAGQLGGVALDVLENEPPDPDNPLLGAPNVVVTPHTAGVSTTFLERAARLAAEKIGTVLDGGRPDKVINPQVYEQG